MRALRLTSSGLGMVWTVPDSILVQDDPGLDTRGGYPQDIAPLIEMARLCNDHVVVVFGHKPAHTGHESTVAAHDLLDPLPAVVAGIFTGVMPAHRDDCVTHTAASRPASACCRSYSGPLHTGQG